MRTDDAESGPLPGVEARVFLGWDRPITDTAPAYLLDSASSDGVCDLSRTVLVASTRRACQDLLRVLARAALDEGRALLVPRIVVPGQVAELALPRERVVADALARQILWREALAHCWRDVRSQLGHPDTQTDDRRQIRTIAARLDAWHELLGIEGMSFARALGLIGEHAELEAVWRAADRVQQEYRDQLARHGLADPWLDPMEALDAGGSVEGVDYVVTVGLPSVPRVVRAIASAVTGFTSLVAAPRGLSDRFDPWGAVRMDAWSGGAELGTAQICWEDTPADEARRALELLARSNGQPHERLVIGIPDPAVGDAITACAAGEPRFRAWDASGVSWPKIWPGRLLNAVADLIRDQRFEAAATLVRVPAFEAILRSLGIHDAPERLDAGYERTLASRLDELGPECQDVVHAVRSALARLATGERAPVRAWVEAVAGLVDRAAKAWDGAGLEHGPAAVELLGDVLESAWLLGDGPAMTASEALDEILGLAGDTPVPTEPDAGGTELAGWLELATMSAGVVVLTGVNQGVLPTPLPGDPLLTDRVRGVLGLESRRSRHARDAYLLSVIAHTRSPLTLTAHRFDHEGRPALPSSLLVLGGGDAPRDRLASFLDEHAPRERLVSAHSRGNSAGFAVPPRAEARPVETMGVSWFKDYIRSPYGFYLRRVLRLREVDDAHQELTPGQVGELAHAVLRMFARSDESGCADAARLARHLDERLDAEVVRWFGRPNRPAVYVQIEQVRARLREFAARQAQRAREGWRIAAWEWSPSDPVSIDAPGGAMRLSGRIDRLDVHDETGRWELLDYKTGAKQPPPEQAHRTRTGQWLDLQLPLYALLARSMTADAPVRTGYILLSGKEGPTQIVHADWTDDDLESAFERARSVIACIRRGEFADLGDHPPDTGRLGAICGSTLIEDLSVGEHEDDEP